MRYILITIIFFILSTTVIVPQFEEYSMNLILKDQSPMDSEESKPNVELVLPKTDEAFSWGSQIRYSINVKDRVDGDSNYNEINANEVFLEINFLPGHSNSNSKNMQEEIKKNENLKGLTLLGRSSCFGCHADKSSMIGPSFSEIANSYNKGATNIDKLIDSIRDGSSGIWGEAEMPANPDISEIEASDIVEFILTQGSQENNWVYPGLEGVLRIIEKPQGVDKGTYLLTASYTSSSQQRGYDKVDLNIK